MIKVNLVAVGKVKEKYYTDAIKEYAKMLSRFCAFSVIEVQEENYKKVDSALIERIKEKEGERILAQLKGHVIVLTPEGQKYSSNSFAKKLKNLTDLGTGVITFVIGGSYGISNDIKERANDKISFSDMTFPHTLFRVMLTEQIYRAFSINSGCTYDK